MVCLYAANSIRYATNFAPQVSQLLMHARYQMKLHPMTIPDPLDTQPTHAR